MTYIDASAALWFNKMVEITHIGIRSPSWFTARTGFLVQLGATCVSLSMNEHHARR